MTGDQEPLDHRTLAVAPFTRTWELLDQDCRSAKESEMLSAALASRHHRRRVGEPAGGSDLGPHLDELRW